MGRWNSTKCNKGWNSTMDRRLKQDIMQSLLKSTRGTEGWRGTGERLLKLYVEYGELKNYIVHKELKMYVYGRDSWNCTWYMDSWTSTRHTEGWKTPRNTDLKKKINITQRADIVHGVHDSNSTQDIQRVQTVPVAYPEIFFGGVQQIQLRTERMGIWGW